MIVSERNKANNNNNALIVFTREPEAGRTKTRLMPYFSASQCADLHRCMLKDISKELRKADADIIVAYTLGDGSDDSAEPHFLKEIMGGSTVFISQRGDDIGSKMQNAIGDVLNLGYRKVVLIGTDIPEIEAETIDTSFAMLDVCDVVMGPTEDGGYYLIGMKALHPEAFNVRTYGMATVFEETTASLIHAGLKVEKVESYSDIDIPVDIRGFRRRMREDTHLRKSHTGKFLAEKAGISVIVPVYNEAAEIGNLILQLKPHLDECELIIVDGGSTDDTPEIIKNCGDSRIICLNTKKGRAVQMNAGAQASTGDILFFLHCDSILPERFMDEIRRVMAANDWGCFRVGFPSRNFFMMTNCLFSNHRAFSRNLPFGDQGIFIDRDLFFEAGMFPEIPLMEDYEFSMRMRCHKGAKGPGSTRKKLITSTRRYGTGTTSILRTELHMWKLRRMYRKGVSTEIIKSMYDDIR